MASCLGRRKFLAALGGAAAAWPAAASRAQQARIATVGLLSAEQNSQSLTRLITAFHQGLRETGYVEGRNVAIEYRYGEGRNDRLPALAADLVRTQVAVIFAAGIPSALAAKAATTTIPVVFVTGVDPIEGGLVPSINRPGGNVTGINQMNVAIAPKRLELLHKLVPTAGTVALLVDPAEQSPAAETQLRNLRAATRTLAQDACPGGQ